MSKPEKAPEPRATALISDPCRGVVVTEHNPAVAGKVFKVFEKPKTEAFDWTKKTQ